MGTSSSSLTRRHKSARRRRASERTNERVASPHYVAQSYKSLRRKKKKKKKDTHTLEETFLPVNKFERYKKHRTNHMGGAVPFSLPFSSSEENAPPFRRSGTAFAAKATGVVLLGCSALFAVRAT